MAEYIERETLFDEIQSLSVFLGGDNIFHKPAKESVLRIIKEQPTEDVVKVVRCKNCKHFKPLSDGSWTNQNREDGICYALVNYHGSERYCVKRKRGPRLSLEDA